MGFNLLENNKIVVAINIKCVYLLVNQFYNMHIVYKSKPMPIHIDEYEHNSFEYDKWIISDDYRELKPGYEYRIIVSTKGTIKDYNDLTYDSILASGFVEKLTMLLKYVLGISLNSPYNQIFRKRIRAIDFREIPKGWEANIAEIDTYLMETLPSFARAVPIPTNGNMKTSILDELHIALNNYDSLDEEIKDLIAVHNSAIESDERACYLIMGKLIDMINWLYPLKHRLDRRIKETFPELIPFFGDTTIKDLMGIANSRKETRHYNASPQSPHPALTNQEAELYFQRIDILALDIVRIRLVLPIIAVDDE